MKKKLLKKLLVCCFCIVFTFDLLYPNVISVRAEEEQSESICYGATVEATTMQSSYYGENYRIDFRVSDSWEGGYQADIIIMNTSDQKIEDWRIALPLDSSITNIWNATISDSISGYTMVKNAGWNQDIDAGSTISFGFLSDQTFQACPKQIFLFGDVSEVNANDYEVKYSVEQVWDSGYNGLITIVNNGTKIIEDWNLQFTFNNQIRDIWDAVILQQDGQCYQIGNATYNQNIDIGESISFGFTVDSVSFEILPEKFILTSITDGKNRNQDSDGDGLADCLELEIGTNPYMADSDGDEIQDAYEYIILLTDPLCVDTDENGIWDGEEDFDEDGLVNKSEFEYGTDPFLVDSDGEGLSDYDEIFEYNTNPIAKDSDEDGLEDDDELLFGFDPWNPDSNNNTILDGDEKIDQQKVMAIAEEELPAVTKVTVDISISGNVNKVLDVENLYKIDMLSSDVVGLVSIPVAITTEREFEQAVITFYYDETQLGKIKEENLAVMWYDEVNNWYQILDEDTVIDKENNTISYTTSHFSTYMLVDKEEWYNVWKNDIDYRNRWTSDSSAYDFEFVVDVSGSMRGSAIENAKSALIGFLDAIDDCDNISLITFNSSASIVVPFSSERVLIPTFIQSLAASGGTNVNSGIQAGIKEFNNLNSENQKIMILICDGDVNYNANTISTAVGKGIQIYTVNVGSTSASKYLKRIAQETGGEYYYCRSSNEIETMLGEIQGETVGIIDTTDTDGDGLFDVYETKGFRLVNGRLIQSDPNKEDTDGDGLTDFEEIGIVYNIAYVDSMNIFRYIGNSETDKAPYIMAYSDPQKKDTDDDGIKDDVDPYPWSKTCSQDAGGYAHKHLVLGDDGYYTCKDCGCRIKSPALQDAEVLTEEDYATVMACNVMFAYYTELVYELYGTVDYLSLNQKLLINQIAKIRQNSRYKDCYEYSNENGICICDVFTVDSNAICTVDISKMNAFNLGMYNKTIPNTASVLVGKIKPEAGLLVMIIGDEVMRDADQKITPMEVAGYVLSAAGCFDSEEKICEIISNVGTGMTLGAIIDSVANPEITMDDYELTIYLHRGGTGRSVKQSHGMFVVSGEGNVKWHQYTEYGFETWEERLRK